MCGIAGVYRPAGARDDDAERVTRMLARLAHRGPDETGLVREGCVVLGATRLAIIDPAGGHQPFRSRASLLVGNGEVYNHARLRAGIAGTAGACDLAVVPWLADSLGPSFPGVLHGVFALAVYRPAPRRLYLVRDRVGVKPLYVADIPGGVVFASEIKALLALDDVPSRLDKGAIWDSLFLGFCPGPSTAFVGIRAVEPGTTVEFAPDGTRQVHRFWSLPSEAPLPSSLDEAAATARVLATETIAERLASDVAPIGCFLSGGIDSSAVLALAARVGSKRLVAYTLHAGRSDTGASDDDLDAARSVARGHGVPHRVLPLPEPTADLMDRVLYHLEAPAPNVGNALGFFTLAAAARRDGVKVVLLGEGADEAFGGYGVDLLHHLASTGGTPDPERLATVLGRSVANVQEARALWAAHIDAFAHIEARLDHPLPSLAHPHLHRVEYAGLVVPRLLGLPPGAPVRLPWAGSGAAGTLAEPARSAWVDARTRLEGYIIPTRERTTMAFGVEARFPLLDHRILEWAFHLPPSMRWHGGELKAVWRRAVAPWLPAAVARRPKRGLFIHGVLDPVDHPDLARPALEDVGLFDPDVVEALRQGARAARSGGLRALHTDMLGRIQVIQALGRLFTKGRQDK